METKMTTNKLEKVMENTIGLGLALIVSAGVGAVADSKYSKYLFGAGILLAGGSLIISDISYSMKIDRMQRENLRSYHKDSQ